MLLAYSIILLEKENMHNYLFFKNLFFIIFSILILSNCDSSSKSYELKDFSIKDTASIVKFKISDTENNSIVISRVNESKIWMIEGSNYNATKPSVDLLMETFYRIRVKQDVPNSSLKTIFNRLSVKHKKVEIFTNENENPIKTWYIGSPTQDHMGTYMLLQNDKIKSSIPYITYKPGMYGSLDVRFFTDFESWRSSKVFHYQNSNHIKNIRVNFHTNKIESYHIERKDNSVLIYDTYGKLISNYDTIQVRHYLTHFNNINYNKVMNFKQDIIDSIFLLSPHCSFVLNDIYGLNKVVDFWKIRDKNSETGWDKEYGFIRIDKNNELLRAQYFNWEILFKPLSYFK